MIDHQVIESMVAQQLEDNETQVEKKELEQMDSQRMGKDEEIQSSGVLWRRGSDPRVEEHQRSVSFHWQPIGLDSECVTPSLL